MRLIFDPPVSMPNQITPSPRSMVGREGIGPNLIDVVPTRWQAADILASFRDQSGVKAIIAAADSVHGRSPNR
jgi:hypothetical protein